MHKMSTPYLAEMELYRNPDLNTRGDEMRPPLDWAAVYEKSAEGKHLEAIQLITDSDPAKHSATKSYLKAQLYLKANQLDQAESAVNSLLNGSKGELKEEGLWLKALILIQKGEEAQAKILLKEIITNKQYMWLEAQKLITQ